MPRPRINLSQKPARLNLSPRPARALALTALLACAPAPAEPVPKDTPLEPAADPAQIARGHALLGELQCARCHDGDALTPPPRERHCVRCHQSILAGDFPAPAADLTRWQHAITHLRELPELRGMSRLRRSFVARFVQSPHDLRPGLATSMPRLHIDAAAAEAIAAALIPEAEPANSEPPGDPERGRTILGDAGCTTCHRFTGVPTITARPLSPALEPALMLRASEQAPDLRFTRDRLRPAALHTWLADPAAHKPGTLMPDPDLRPDQIRDVATYLLTAPLEPLPPPVLPVMLPLLDREVRFAEVDAAIFHKTCWHCHSDPSYASGDGGPGNTGGLGFAGPGLDLSSHPGIISGSHDPAGKPRSIFTPLPDGTPRIVAHLLARHAELAGATPELRGMPLGLTPVPLPDIQLLATWISQGRKP